MHKSEIFEEMAENAKMEKSIKHIIAADRRKLKREKNSKEEGDQSSPTPVVSP